MLSLALFLDEDLGTDAKLRTLNLTNSYSSTFRRRRHASAWLRLLRSWLSAASDDER
jgi:hypothetical protein